MKETFGIISLFSLPKKLGVQEHPVQPVHPVYPVHPVHPLFNCILRKESNGTELSLGSQYLGFVFGSLVFHTTLKIFKKIVIVLVREQYVLSRTAL